MGRPRRARLGQVIQVQAAALSGLLGAAAGPVDWYARHRQLWIETGDPDELTRMLRHPLPPSARVKPTRHVGNAREWAGAVAVMLAVLAAVVLVSRFAL
jgi:hypothetical protein